MIGEYELVVNGRTVRVVADGSTPLLSVLRDVLGCAAAGSAAAPSNAEPAWC
jgi:hypothetical protein